MHCTLLLVSCFNSRLRRPRHSALPWIPLKRSDFDFKPVSDLALEFIHQTQKAHRRVDNGSHAPHTLMTGTHHASVTFTWHAMPKFRFSQFRFPFAEKVLFAESLGKFSDLKFEYLPRTHAQGEEQPEMVGGGFFRQNSQKGGTVSLFFTNFAEGSHHHWGLFSTWFF